MYIPGHFHIAEATTIFDFAERHGFATLVTTRDGEPFASHLPLLVDRAAGPHGTIIGHMARANPQWQSAAGQTVLVIFSGPHAYVSPTWYAEPNTVPTWNYTTVHAYGKLEIVDEASAVKAIVRDTVNRYERAMPQPWRLDESAPSTDALVKQIVGFRIPIDRWEGKFKLSQNHSAERRERVIDALEQQGDDDSQAIAHLMREWRDGTSPGQ